jgi:hypothetical protein
MATNLKAATEALRQKQPKQKYEIEFEQTESFRVTVDAIDQIEAEELAQKEFDNGNAHEVGNCHVEIINSEIV